MGTVDEHEACEVGRTTPISVAGRMIGNPLVAVSGSPAIGQYSVSNGAYTFNAADAGEAMLISYGFVPYDLANACAQWVAELLQYQTRPGVRSKSLGGQETVSYVVGKMPPTVAGIIAPYRRVALICP